MVGSAVQRVGRTQAMKSTLAANVLLLISVFILSGCDASQTVTKNDKPKSTITAEQLIERHNARASKLDELSAYGVIEMRWTDDKGEHYEQADVDLWVDQPSRTAMRVDKFGEVFIWLGSNDQDWWLFDLTSTPSTLFTGTIDSMFDSDGRGVAPVHPLTLLDLLGITTLQTAKEARPIVDPTTGDLILAAHGQRGALRLRFDPTGTTLLGVVALDDAGMPVATSQLRDLKSVRIPGTNLLNWPKMATVIDITLAGTDGSVKLALNSDISGRLDEDLADRIFDIEALKQSLQPDRIKRTEGMSRIPPR